jgi:acetyltransferase-like isoleucine patch superfamily enzyme
MHPGAAIPNDAFIGHRVYIGPNVVLANDARPYVGMPSAMHHSPEIEDDAVIGANAVLLPGVIIGRGALVGAGAVVTRSVPPFTTVVGNPAWVLRAACNEAGEEVPYG